MSRIALVVEGHGEVEAMPVLVRRIADEVGESGVEVSRPIRVKRQRIVRDDLNDLERVLRLISSDPEVGGVLIVVDADEDCPATLGTQLRSRAEEYVGHLAVRAVVAKAEYEAWLLAGMSGLRGKRQIPEDAEEIDDPEQSQNPKALLKQLNGALYSETIDQPAMTGSFDLGEARVRSASFDKFYRDVSDLLSAR